MLNEFTNTEVGVRSEVIKTYPGFGVRLIDTDAAAAVPYVRFFPTEDAAVAYARSLVA